MAKFIVSAKKQAIRAKRAVILRKKKEAPRPQKKLLVAKRKAIKKSVVEKRGRSEIKKAKSGQKKISKIRKNVKASGRQRVAKKILATQEAMTERQEQRLIKEEAKQKKMQKKELEKQRKMEKEKILEIEPNNKISQYLGNSLLDPCYKKQSKKESRVFELKSCCIFCNNREILQCVKYGDVEGLKKGLKNFEQISNPYQNYSVACRQNILSEIAKSKNVELLKTLIDYENKIIDDGKFQRVKLPSISLQKQGTGQANKYQFYFPIRQVKLSRGGKEGNNAFADDLGLRKVIALDYYSILKHQPPVSFIKLINSSHKNLKGRFLIHSYETKNHLAKIARSGNFELLKHLIKASADQYGMGFNKLHTSSILQGKECDTLKSVSKPSLMKKAYDNSQLMPGHLAAVNPDPTIFKKFFKVYPSIMQLDIDQRDLVHYAAANQNSDTLEFLISKKVDINNRDSKGVTPLMIACKLSRVANVKLILEEQKRQLDGLDEDDEDYNNYLEFHKYTNNTGPFKQTPLHYACKKGSLQIVKLLVEEGEADIEAKNFYSNTALGVAAEHGHLDIVEYLIKKGANVHGVDKQMKSPLIRACINGQIHVVAFLLRHGVNPNFKDNSENTALHYACAYGWLNIVKLLIEEGKADPNVLNEWKTSAILIAMLKGHFGIVDYLIDLKNINASFQDEDGRTLISQLCMNINEESGTNLKYLLEKGKIDAKLKDVDGLTALHHLASNNVQQIATDAVKTKEEQPEEQRFIYRRGKKIKLSNKRRRYGRQNKDENVQGYFPDEKDQAEYKKRVKELEDSLVKCATLLIKQGLSLKDQTDEDHGSMTPLFVAITSQNYAFAEWLVEKDPTSIQGTIKEGGQNILHMLAKDFYKYSKNILPLLLKGNKQILGNLIYAEDDEGYTPYLSYFQQLATLREEYFSTDYWNSISEPAKKYVKENYIPNGMKILNQVTAIYAKDLNYDISTQVGISKDGKKKLEKLLKEACIDQETYRKIKSLQYDEVEEEKKKKELEKAKKEEKKMEIDKKNTFTLKYDEIDNYDPQKKRLGLLQEGVANLKEEEVTRTRRKTRPGKRHSHNYNNDEEDEDDQKIIVNFEDFELDINQIYEEESNIMKTSLHILIEEANQLQELKGPEFIQLIHMSLDLSRHFIQKKDSVYQQGFNKLNRNRVSILNLSLKNESKEILTELLNSQSIRFDQPQKDSQLTLLHLVSKLKDREIVNLIFKNIKQFNVNDIDRNGNTPLHYAAYLRNEYCLQELLKFGAKINVLNKFGVNALHLSLFAFDETKDHTPKIERILIDEKINMNQIDSDGRTPLHYLFNMLGESDEKRDPASVTMVLLKNKNLDINVKDKNLDTPLIEACGVGATISALALINQGADLNASNLRKNTPFSVCMLREQSELAILLIQNGINVNQLTYSYEAKKSINDTKSLKKLFERTILPFELKKKLFCQKQTFKDYKDYEEKMYNITIETPFKQALENNQGGLSHLLLSKNIDPYESLINCLETHKYEMFLELLENEKKQNFLQKLDKKGRNLLFILMKTVCKEKALKVIDRSIDIMTILVQNYKQDITHTDINKRNILHKIGKAQNQELFKKVLNQLNANQKKLMLNQKDKKCEAIPAIYLLKVSDFKKNLKQNKEDQQILEILNVKNMDLSFIEKSDKLEEQKVQIPSYLHPQSLFPIFEEEKKQIKTTFLHKVIRNISKLQQHEIKDYIENIKLLGLDFNIVEPGTGRSLLMTAILQNNENVIKLLLGYQYDQKKNEIVFKNKPLVNVNSQDQNGLTALHYAIRPSNYGLFMNYEVIKLLLEAKASPQICDNEGYNAMDYSSESPIIQELIKKHFVSAKPNKNKAPQRKEIKSQKSFKAQQSFNQQQMNGVQSNDYQEDAEKYLKQMNEKKKQEKMEVDKGKKKKEEVEVDKVSKLEKSCKVVKSEEVGYYYDLWMVKIDVKRHFFGVNNFYVIQILHDTVKNIYILWTRWGRIGDEGQFQRTPFDTLDECVKEFKKVYRQKVGAKWEEIDNYVPVPKKYKLKKIGGKVIYQEAEGMHWKYSERQIEIKDLLVNFSDFKLVKSKLSDGELDFMKSVVNQAGILRKAISSSLQKDLFLKAFLDRETVTKLNKILDKIQEQIKAKEKASQSKDFDNFEVLMNKIFDYSNEYYEAICPIDYAFSKMRSLDNKAVINQERDKLQIIYDFEHVTKLLFGALYRIKEINPYDYCFNTLKTKIFSLNDDSDEYKLIIFKLQDNNMKGGKNSAVNKDNEFNSIHNHFMLFHGTSKANVLSIIEQGLKIKPQNSAGEHGSAFGQGIYFADQFSLAANVKIIYIINSLSMLVMGQFNPEDKGYNSLRMMGSNGPNFNMNLLREDETIWPVGEIQRYEYPIIRQGKEVFSSYKEFINKTKNQNKKKKPVKKVKKAARKVGKKSKNQQEDDDDDIEMIDTSSRKKNEDEDEEEDSQNEENEDDAGEDIEGEEQKEYQEQVNQKEKRYQIETNVVSFSKFQYSYQWNNTMSYQINESQYVVFNSDQVRVRYALHFTYEDPAEDEDEEDEDEDKEEEEEEENNDNEEEQEEDE